MAASCLARKAEMNLLGHLVDSAGIFSTGKLFLATGLNGLTPYHYRAVEEEVRPMGSAVREGAIKNKGLGAQELLFVHSSFRTSSTWLWLAFRRIPEVLAYYEVFNPFLGRCTEGTLQMNSTASWNSRHPVCSPYFEEYRALLRPSSASRAILQIWSWPSSTGRVAALQRILHKMRNRVRGRITTPMRLLGQWMKSAEG